MAGNRPTSVIHTKRATAQQASSRNELFSSATKKAYFFCHEDNNEHVKGCLPHIQQETAIHSLDWFLYTINWSFLHIQDDRSYIPDRLVMKNERGDKVWLLKAPGQAEGRLKF